MKITLLVKVLLQFSFIPFIVLAWAVFSPLIILLKIERKQRENDR